jgi:SAM-dependent methyltransferase
MGSFVPFIPTQPEGIHNFFELAPVSAADVVYDLGCGDGRLLFAALEKGAGRAVGIELNPGQIRVATELATKKGLSNRITLIEGDVMDADLSEATVVLCYLISAASAALKPKFESDLKPGTRIVMESFPVPRWKPIDVREDWYANFYLYRMPPEAISESSQQTVYPDYGYL